MRKVTAYKISGDTLGRTLHSRLEPSLYVDIALSDHIGLASVATGSPHSDTMTDRDEKSVTGKHTHYISLVPWKSIDGVIVNCIHAVGQRILKAKDLSHTNPSVGGR